MSEDALARDLFHPARVAPEPDWSPDAAAFLHAGRRRRTVRRLRVGGLAAGVAAVTAGTLLLGGHGGTVPDPAVTSAPPPRQLTPAQLSGYVTVDTTATHWRQAAGDGYAIPSSALRATSTIVTSLDPGLKHLRSGSTVRSALNAVGDATFDARNTAEIGLASQWTTDGAPVVDTPSEKPTGALLISFFDSARRMRPTGDPVSSTTEPCGIGTRSPDSSPWSPCTVVALPDGSQVESTVMHNGPGTVVEVVREFPGGAGGIVVHAADFDRIGGRTPDASQIVTPTPWTVQSLVAALSDPGAAAGLPSDADPHGPPGFLNAADLGGKWSYDDGQAPRPGDLPLGEPHCGGTEQTATPLDPALGGGYTGVLPSGASAVVQESAYRLGGPAQASAALSTLRSNVSRPCPSPAVRPEVELPHGVGDEAVVVFGAGYTSGDAYIRVGSTILHLTVQFTATGPAPAAGHHFSSADRLWFGHLLAQAQSRYSSDGGKD